MDPQLTMSINKVTQGNFCVKPQDEVGNRGEGNNNESERKKSSTTIEDVERFGRLKSEIPSGGRLKFPGIGSKSLGNDTRYKSEATLQQERRKSAGDEDVLKQLNVNVRVTHFRRWGSSVSYKFVIREGLGIKKERKSSKSSYLQETSINVRVQDKLKNLQPLFEFMN